MTWEKIGWSKKKQNLVLRSITGEPGYIRKEIYPYINFVYLLEYASVFYNRDKIGGGGERSKECY